MCIQETSSLQFTYPTNLQLSDLCSNHVKKKNLLLKQNRRPKHLERAQPAGAVLGEPDAAAPRGARDDGGPALVDAAVHAAAGDDRGGQLRVVRGGRARGPGARPAGDAVRPLHQQRAGGRRVRLPLPLEPDAGRGAVRPGRGRRPRRHQHLPGHGLGRRGPVLHESLSGGEGGLSGVLC